MELDLTPSDEEPNVIIALYDGRCGVCDERIYEGDRIKRIDYEWCHEHCDG